MTTHEFYKQHECTPEEMRELSMYLVFIRMKSMLFYFVGVKL